MKISDVDEDDVAIDASGYTGIMHRNIDEKALIPLSMDEFIEILHKNNKLVDIMRIVREIDHDHNGYVTSTELDDIIKLTYKDEL